MSVIAVMIGASLMLAGGFLLAFLWAVRSGQYDDRVTPSIRMLFDERDPASRDSNQHLS
jgi:cbb3-type cytochrome oxidase maturation protein